MKTNRIPDYLDHMIGAARQVRDYLDGLARDDFFADRRTQQAVILNMLILGEAATQLLKEYEAFTVDYSEVPWKNMKGMRNRVAHGYFDIDLSVVWDTAQTALPPLLEQLLAIRQTVGGG